MSAYIRVILSFALLLLIFVLTSGIAYAYDCLESKEISCEIDGKPLLRVIDLFVNDSDCTVYVPESLKEITISGKYRNVTLGMFLKRILRGYNYSIETTRGIDRDGGETVRVLLFRSITASGKLRTPLLLQSSKGKVQGKTLGSDNSVVEEMKARQVEQLARYAAWREDPDATDPMTGLRRGELKARQAEQLARYAAWREDPDATDPMTGLRRGELKARQAKQLAVFRARTDRGR